MGPLSAQDYFLTDRTLRPNVFWSAFFFGCVCTIFCVRNTDLLAVGLGIVRRASHFFLAFLKQSVFCVGVQPPPPQQKIGAIITYHYRILFFFFFLPKSSVSGGLL